MITSLFIAAVSRAFYLNSVDERDLKRHVTYLASDELEGRATPSRGLEKAATYIADELKKSGASPGLGDSYFQVAPWKPRRAADATEPPQTAKNVIGIIKGSDPVLADQAIVVTAHYDHLGMGVFEGDKIYNGANDNASGVSGVLEACEAISNAKPKRTVIFIAFYGEESGMIGSTYYVNNPVWPLLKTVANINLEQIGRTDDSEGPRVSAISMTGYDFTSIGKVMSAAGRPLGVDVSGHPKFSAPYFGASDNISFARKGIPCGTVCTAFSFADYHGVGDHADKLDYKNMVKIVQTAAAGVVMLANATDRPTWNVDNPATKRYIDAAAKLHGGG